MSSSPSPFGIERFPDDDGAVEVAAPTPARERTPIDPRLLRSLLGGAAAVAVLGAGAAGFLWLSSTPSGDVADAALGGVRSTPAAVGETGPVRATGVAFGEHDLFATSAAATTGDAGGASTGSDGAAGPTTAPSPARPGGAAGSASTSAPSSASSSSVPAVAPPVVRPVVPPVVPPAVSSAPGWVTPVVRFVGGSAASGTFDVDGETRTVALGQAVYPLSLVYAGTVTESTPTPSSSSSSSTSTAPPDQLGVLLSAGDSSAGWIVPPDSALPDVVVGRTRGRVRVIGLLREQYFLRVDRQDDVLQAAGSAVEGTDLTYTGQTNEVHTRWAAQAGDPSLAQGEVYFTVGGVVSFGRFGAGEADGVSY